MAVEDRIREPIDRIVTDHDATLYDLQFAGGVLRLMLEKEGGLGLDVITSVSRAVSRLLDDIDPIPGRFTLEVTSPGLERRLRLPEHFAGAIGERVSVKTIPGHEGRRRFEATIDAVDDSSVTFGLVDEEPIILTLDQIQRAQTVFDWNDARKAGSARSKKKTADKADKKATKP